MLYIVIAIISTPIIEKMTRNVEVTGTTEVLQRFVLQTQIVIPSYWKLQLFIASSSETAVQVSESKQPFAVAPPRTPFQQHAAGFTIPNVVAVVHCVLPDPSFS